LEIRARNLIVWSSIFAGVLLLSLILYLARPGRTDGYVLFFPSEITGEWVGEARDIRHTRIKEEAVLALLKEFALGPVGLQLEPALPKGTGIRSVLLRKETVYLDFTAQLAVSYQSLSISFAEMLEGIEKTVLYNFPSIDTVVMYVEGSPVDAYRGSSAMKSGGFAFSGC